MMPSFKYSPVSANEKLDSASASDSDLELPLHIQHRHGWSRLSLALVAVSLITISVCSTLVGTKIYHSRLENRVVDTQKIFPRCKPNF